MKILKGSLKETVYHMPSPQSRSTAEAEPLQIKKETLYQEQEVAYISDKIGLHYVANHNSADLAVSMHRKHSGEQLNLCWLLIYVSVHPSKRCRLRL